MAEKSKIESFFNIPPADEVKESEALMVPVKTRADLYAEADTVISALNTADKIDFALPVVTGLEHHDTEMDDIAKKAMQTYEDLVSLGCNIQDIYAGKVFEVAGQMLKTALEAKTAKADKKLRMIELQLKKARLEQNDFVLGTGNVKEAQNNQTFDRNELIKFMVDASKSELDPNSDK